MGRRGDEAPYLVSIAQKAELLIKLYENRQKTTQETLEEMKKIIAEINAAQREQAEKGMSSDVFTTYWLLKQSGFGDAEAMANQMKEVFEKYPHWRKSERYEKEVRTRLYKVILDWGTRDAARVSEVAQNIMQILTLRGGASKW